MNFKDRYLERVKPFGGPYGLIKMGVTRGAIDSIMRGSIPRGDRALIIADLLNTGVRWLLTGEESPDITPEERTLLKAFRAADTRAKKDALHTLETHKEEK